MVATVTTSRRLVRLLTIIRSMVLLFFVTSAAYAQTDAERTPPTETCSAPQMRTHIRPDSEGSPTVVKTGVRVIDIREINDVDQTITVDLAMRRVWTDHRLDGLQGCRLPIADVWFPELILVNSGRLFERWPETVVVGADGEVTYMQRVSGSLASYHTLHDFPFDTQSIDIGFLVLDYDPSEVVLEMDESFLGISAITNISDWTINGVEAKLADFESQGFNENRMRLDVTISAERIRAFYVWKVILPISLIVFMSWSVFWIDPALYGPQIGLSATSMLTIIAFIFATTNMLPPLGYFTLLDVFIGGATILVFLALLVSLTTTYFNSIKYAESAKQLDRICRVVFPIAYIGFSYAVFYRDF